MFDKITRILDDMATEKKMFTSMAQIYYNMYSALKEAGFNSDQAIQIVCSHKVLPSSSTSSN